jgi:hypothetical protein
MIVLSHSPTNDRAAFGFARNNLPFEPKGSSMEIPMPLDQTLFEPGMKSSLEGLQHRQQFDPPMSEPKPSKWRGLPTKSRGPMLPTAKKNHLS